MLSVYCLALLPHIVMELLAATMRGMGSMKAPMFAGLAAIGVNVLLCRLLVPRVGPVGVAAAMVGGYLAGAALMGLLAMTRFRRLREGTGHVV